MKEVLATTKRVEGYRGPGEEGCVRARVASLER